MSAQVVQIRRAPSDLAARLRELADAAEAGRLTDFVGSYVYEGQYEFLYGASMADCVVMSSMLWSNSVERMRK